jgi:uncharacterized OB-fold protein
MSNSYEYDKCPNCGRTLWHEEDICGFCENEFENPD